MIYNINGFIIYGPRMTKDGLKMIINLWKQYFEDKLIIEKMKQYEWVTYRDAKENATRAIDEEFLGKEFCHDENIEPDIRFAINMLISTHRFKKVHIKDIEVISNV